MVTGGMCAVAIRCLPWGARSGWWWRVAEDPAVVDGLVELSGAIGLVREQLVAAQLAGRRVVAGRVLTFAVGKVVLEFTGEIKTTVGGGGGVKFWVLTADAKAERASGAGHKVSIELIPQGPDGQSFIVADGVDTPPGYHDTAPGGTPPAQVPPAGSGAGGGVDAPPAG